MVLNTDFVPLFINAIAIEFQITLIPFTFGALHETLPLILMTFLAWSSLIGFIMHLFPLRIFGINKEAQSPKHFVSVQCSSFCYYVIILIKVFAEFFAVV